VSRLELRRESVDDAPNIIAQPAQAADIGFVLPPLAKNHAVGRFEVHVHVRALPNDQLRDPCVLCAIFHADRRLVLNLDVGDGARRGKRGFHIAARQCSWVDPPVLVCVTEFTENLEQLPGLASVVWLGPPNHCLVPIAQTAQMMAFDFAFEGPFAIADGELRALTTGVSPQDRQLTDQKIERRAQVVGYVADQDPELDRGWLIRPDGANYGQAKAGASLYFRGDAIGVKVNEPTHLAIERFQMLPCLPNLRPAPIEGVRHA
jgi:hypothetical protein